MQFQIFFLFPSCVKAVYYLKTRKIHSLEIIADKKMKKRLNQNRWNQFQSSYLNRGFAWNAETDS